jgi:hypothetical protein
MDFDGVVVDDEIGLMVELLKLLHFLKKDGSGAHEPLNVKKLATVFIIIR